MRFERKEKTKKADDDNEAYRQKGRETKWREQQDITKRKTPKEKVISNKTHVISSFNRSLFLQANLCQDDQPSSDPVSLPLASHGIEYFDCVCFD